MQWIGQGDPSVGEIEYLAKAETGTFFAALAEQARSQGEGRLIGIGDAVATGEAVFAEQLFEAEVELSGVI